MCNLGELRASEDVTSSDSSRTAPTAPLLGWLHLIGMPFEVHASRKVSFGKCSHQGLAHWHHSIPCTVTPPSEGAGSFKYSSEVDSLCF